MFKCTICVLLLLYIHVQRRVIVISIMSWFNAHAYLIVNCFSILNIIHVLWHGIWEQYKTSQSQTPYKLYSKISRTETGYEISHTCGWCHKYDEYALSRMQKSKMSWEPRWGMQQLAFGQGCICEGREWAREGGGGYWGSRGGAIIYKRRAQVHPFQPISSPNYRSPFHCQLRSMSHFIAISSVISAVIMLCDSTTIMTGLHVSQIWKINTLPRFVW